MYKQISFTQLLQSAGYATVAATTVVAMLFISFFLAEPAITHGQAVDTDTFTISQTIVDESSFLVAPNNVTTDGSINGISGGTATGTTDFSVQSNNSSGYYVEIGFFDNGTANAMLSASTSDESIRDFDDTAGEPTFAFTASTAAQFGYSVTSDTPTDTDPSFLDDAGDVCNNGGAEQTALACWKSPAVAGFRIVDRSAAAPTGATSTLVFRVTVPSNPVPQPVSETYYATATLSLFVK